MGLLQGKNILITGVLTDSSIAFHVAQMAQEQGARIVLTGYGRLSLVQRIASRLPDPPPVVNLDVTDPAEIESLADRLRPHLGVVHGVLHSVAYAPPSALGGDFMKTSWSEASRTLHVSTFSLKEIAGSLLPLMPPGASIVGLDFDARLAWPGYDWMGVSKAGLESCARYLASHMGPRGIRVNLVAAGPLRTLAALATYGGDTDPHAFERQWDSAAPLGWDARDFTPVASACVALMSNWFPSTTGEIVHVDGGAHAVPLWTPESHAPSTQATETP